MSCPLSVSSFPDINPTHNPPLDVDLPLLVAPTPTKRRGGITNVIKDLFVRDHDHPVSRNNFPHGTYDSSIQPTNLIQGEFSERPSHNSHIHLVPATPTIDEWHDHNSHHRSWSQATSPMQCPSSEDSWYELHQYPMPRSTKESIASLGLSRSCPSSDCEEYPDPRFMVTVCSARNWVETPSLPPLPPLPPRKEGFFENPIRPSSALSWLSNSTHGSEIGIEMVDDHPEPSTRPPSPICFTDRASSYIAAGSSSRLTSLETMSNPNNNPSFPSSSNSRGHASSPSVTSVRRRVSPPAPPPIEMMGHLRVYPILTSGLFSSKPKQPKSKPKRLVTSSTSASPSTPSSSPSKALPKMPVWKRFRRRHSISGFVTSPTSTEFPSEAAQVTSTESVNRTLGRTSSPTHSDYSAPSMHTVTDRIDPPPSVRFGGKDIDGPHVIAHTHVGGVWQEKDVNEVISTLRTMKVSGRITPKFKG
ncbi:hypothetical protein QCA50_013793 [Cerrena zonata]|uniref:Uncharacterized protein n=1 Tax=Cerrena zonata TaxID=2478898 RepID=A0AAW0FW49_9APHY